MPAFPGMPAWASAGYAVPAEPAAPSPAVTSHRVKLAAASTTSTASDDPPASVALCDAIEKSSSSTLVAAPLIRSGIAPAPPAVSCVFCVPS